MPPSRTKPGFQVVQPLLRHLPQTGPRTPTPLPRNPTMGKRPQRRRGAADLAGQLCTVVDIPGRLWPYESAFVLDVRSVLERDRCA